MMQAFMETFPAIVIMGCYFHWSQLIIKRVKGAVGGRLFIFLLCR